MAVLTTSYARSEAAIEPLDDVGELVAGDPEVDGFGARRGDEGAQTGAVGVGDPGRPKLLAGRSDLVAGGQDRDPRPFVDDDLAETRTGQERQRGSTDRGTRHEERRAILEVTARGADGTAAFDRDVGEDRDRHGARCVATAWTPHRFAVEWRRVFDRDDRVRAFRDTRAGRDPGGRPGPDHDVGGRARPDIAVDGEADRLVLTRPGRVGRDDRVAVHRGVVPGRQRDPGDRGLGQHPAERLGDGDANRGARCARRERRVSSLFDAAQTAGRGMLGGRHAALNQVWPAR
jgi:hypothetical protein